MIQTVITEDEEYTIEELNDLFSDTRKDIILRIRPVYEGKYPEPNDDNFLQLINDFNYLDSRKLL